MSLESDVAQVLRSPPADRISFKVENIAIDGTQMDLVAKAIEKQDISVVTAALAPSLEQPIRPSSVGDLTPEKRS